MRNRRGLTPSFRGVVLAIAFSLSMGGFSARAADPDNFRVRATEDLVKLCSADPADPNYVAAIHFCHGFGSGAYQYYESVTTPSERFVCLPNPPPTRSEAIAGFVTWARANPQYMAERPADSIFRYLSSRYPCGQ
jgi:Rap1a immunity proteins